MQETGIPNDLNLYNVLKYDGVISRINSYQPANPQNGYAPGQLLTFQMPMEFLDFRNGSFQFTLTNTAPGSTYAYFNRDIRSIFKRITLSFGSKVIYDCQNQNLLYNIMDLLKDPQWKEYNGKVLNSTGSQAERTADFNNPNRVYAVQLYDLRQELLSHALPLQKLNVQLYINIYLAPVNECITTDSLTPNYTLNNAQFHISSLIASPGWNSLYDSRISMGIPYSYINFENQYDSSILTAGTTRASKSLNFRYSSLTGIIAVMRPSANIQNLTAVDKLNNFPPLNLNTCQLRIGSFVQPTDDLANLADRFSMLCELFGKSTQIPMDAALLWDTSTFIIAQNLSKHPFSQSGNNIDTNGINTSISNNMILDLSFSVPLPANYTLDVFAMSECSVVFQQNGGIIWNN
jgi:hypothetical protein